MFPDFSFRNGVLHFLTKVQLNLPCKKLSPTYVGPFTIKVLSWVRRMWVRLPSNPCSVMTLFTRKLQTSFVLWTHASISTFFGEVRSYRLHTPDIGPPPTSLSSKPVSVEPDGSGWYQIEEILDHRGPETNNGECLVRWKDFDASHDSWIRCHSVTP
jgi:hypothetical protein